MIFWFLLGLDVHVTRANKISPSTKGAARPCGGETLSETGSTWSGRH